MRPNNVHQSQLEADLCGEGRPRREGAADTVKTGRGPARYGPTQQPKEERRVSDPHSRAHCSSPPPPVRPLRTARRSHSTATRYRTPHTLVPAPTAHQTPPPPTYRVLGQNRAADFLLPVCRADQAHWPLLHESPRKRGRKSGHHGKEAHPKHQRQTDSPRGHTQRRQGRSHVR